MRVCSSLTKPPSAAGDRATPPASAASSRQAGSATLPGPQHGVWESWAASRLSTGTVTATAPFSSRTSPAGASFQLLAPSLPSGTPLSANLGMPGALITSLPPSHSPSPRRGAPPMMPVQPEVPQSLLRPASPSRTASPVRSRSASPTRNGPSRYAGRGLATPGPSSPSGASLVQQVLTSMPGHSVYAVPQSEELRARRIAAVLHECKARLDNTRREMNEVLHQRNALWKSLRQAERDFEVSARSWGAMQEELREARRGGGRRRSPGKGAGNRGYSAFSATPASPENLLLSGDIGWGSQDPAYPPTQAYLVDNTQLQASTKGLGLRYSPNLDDMDETIPPAEWGSELHGFPHGALWVKVVSQEGQERFLPTELDGIRVLTPLGERRPTQQAVGTAEIEFYAQTREAAAMPVPARSSVVSQNEEEKGLTRKWSESDLLLAETLHRDTCRLIDAVEACMKDPAAQEASDASVAQEVVDQVAAISKSVLQTVYGADDPEAGELTDAGSRVEAATEYMTMLTQTVVPGLALANVSDEYVAEEPRRGSTRRTTKMTGPAVDTGCQLLAQVADAVFTDLTLREGNTEEVADEHRRTTSYIQLAISDAGLPPEAPDDPFTQLTLAVTQQVVQDRTGTDMPMEEIRARRSLAPVGTSGEPEGFIIPGLQDMPRASVPAFGARRQSAFPVSSPQGSDMGGAGSSRASMADNAVEDSLDQNGSRRSSRRNSNEFVTIPEDRKLAARLSAQEQAGSALALGWHAQAARRMSAMPLSSPQESDAGAVGSRRSTQSSRQGSNAELPAVNALAMQRRPSAVPRSSPKASDAGAAGSVANSEDFRGAEVVGTREPLILGDEVADVPSSDLQGLLAECRKSRRSTMKLLGQSMLESIQANADGQGQKAVSGASSETTVLVDSADAAQADGRRISKQEAAANFVASLMRKAQAKLEDQGRQDESRPFLLENGNMVC